MRPALFLSLLLCIVASRASAAAPRCAVITDPEIGESDRALLELIQINLTSRDDLTLIERDEIQAVLQEQTLSRAFAADGVGARVQLGKLLRADIMVLFRPLSGEHDGMQMVACETKRGLRLAVDTIHVKKEIDPVLEAVTQRIADVVAKAQRKDARICAVPPFVSKDLSYEHDHLKRAYAGLIEQMLLRSGDWHLVELDEAAAIQQEMNLADGNAAVQRDLPLYLFGSFRNTGSNEDRRITIQLAVRRGPTELASTSSRPIDPADAPRFVFQTAAALLADAADMKFAATDPNTEIVQLNARADVFARIGNRGEAINLYQASLLLNPKQPSVHLKLVMLIADHVTRMTDRRAALTLWRRGCDHLVYILRNVPWDIKDPTWYQFAIRDGIALMDHFLRYVPPKDKDGRIPELVFAGRRAVRDAMIASFTDRDMPLGEQRQHAWHLVNLIAASAPVYGETIEASYQAKARAMRALGNATDRYRYAMRLTRMENRDLKAYRKHLASMRGAGDEQFDAFIADRLLDVEDERLPRLRFKPSAKQKAEEPVKHDNGVQYKKLALDTQVAPGGWFHTAFDVDLICSKYAIDRMDKSGKIQRLYAGETEIGDACYDGKRLWAPVAAQTPTLMIIDAKTQRIQRFGAEAGLPPMNRGVAAATITEGQVLLTGAFDGEGQPLRSWCAIVTLNDDKLRVKVVHEAKKPYTEGQPGPEIAYLPLGAGSFTDPSQPDRTYILIRRAMATRRPGYYLRTALRIDLTTQQFDAIQRDIDPDAGWRMRIDNLLPRSFAWFGSWTSIDQVEGSVYAVDSERRLWHASSANDTMRLLGGVAPPPGRPPLLGCFAASAAHGLVLLPPDGSAHAVWIEPTRLTGEPRTPPLPGKVYQQNGRAYLAVTSGSHTWADALRAADSWGGHLMVVNDEKEQQLLEYITRDGRGAYWWLGYTSNGTDTLTYNGDKATFTSFEPTSGKRTAMMPVYTRGNLWMATRENNGHTVQMGFIIEWDHTEGTDSSKTQANGNTMRNTLGMTFRKLKAGRFEMDGTTVTLPRDFWIGTTEVTRGQWRAIMKDDTTPAAGDEYPAVAMSWQHAVGFCNRLSRREGRYYRLPTEAEWEYACRAGAALATARPSNQDQVQPVGSGTTNAWGLHDMLGNVWEWCSDTAGAWTSGPRYDPLHARMGETYIAQVARGGSGASKATELQSDRRRLCNTATRGIGFRVVLDERPAPRGREPWAQAALGSRRYLFYVGKYTWPDAAKVAESLGGKLAVINDEIEHAHLMPYFRMGRGAYWWLGMKNEDGTRPLYTRGGKLLTAPANHEQTSRMGFVVEFESPPGNWATQQHTNLPPYKLPTATEATR